MTVRGLKCPACGKDKHNPKYPYVYMCCDKLLGYYCPNCERFYHQSHVVRNGDLYLCSYCGQPHFGYTEWKQNT